MVTVTILSLYSCVWRIYDWHRTCSPNSHSTYWRKLLEILRRANEGEIQTFTAVLQKEKMNNGDLNE